MFLKVGERGGVERLHLSHMKVTYLVFYKFIPLVPRLLFEFLEFLNKVVVKVDLDLLPPSLY